MPMMVCVKCQLFFHPKKNGVTVEEGMPLSSRKGGDQWVPYKLWHADILECRGCGTEVIAGFASRPIAEHYQEEYKSIKAQLCPVVFVKDCM